VTLHRPVEEEDTASLVRGITQSDFPDPQKLNQDLSASVNRVIMRCLSHEQKKRYVTGAELADDIRVSEQVLPVFDGIVKFFRSFGFRQEERPAVPTLSRATEKAHISPVIGSGENRSAAVSLLREAETDYYIDFKYYEAMEKLVQAIELDHSLVDAYILLYCVYSTMGEMRLLREKLPALKSASEGLSELELLKLSVLELSLEGSLKPALKLAGTYRNQCPDDMGMLWFMFMLSEPGAHFAECLDYMSVIIRRHPDWNAAYLGMAEIYGILGETEKAAALLEERIGRHPDLHNLSLLMIQQYLYTGEYARADLLIDRLLSDDPSLDWAVFYKARLCLATDRLEQAADLLRRAIGLVRTPSFKSSLYYALYKTFNELGDAEKAERNFTIACNLGPEWHFKKVEDIHSHVEGFDLSRLTAEGMSPQFMELAKGHAKKVCTGRLNRRVFIKYFTYGIVTCVELDKDLNPCLARIYADYNSHFDEESERHIVLASVPYTPFTDHMGNILETGYKKCPSRYGRFVATVRHTTPVKSGEACFLCAEFDTQDTAGWENGRLTLTMQKYPVSTCRPHAFLLCLPEGCIVESMSEEPDEYIDLPGKKVLVWFRFFHKGQEFPARVVLKKN
ncbi:MAG: tetratricopeptide repeat-containing serine/threonine-protein kinase, partial [Candidatus Wallbacteria bacterium]|nr:tetratricopeptide repeat-containing serine/threonine-protein kinase [Candidatus Wallbacteria bacterium]